MINYRLRCFEERVMEVAEFDRFADEYYNLHQANIKITGETPEFFAAYKVIEAAKQAASMRLAANRILDFGSGIGNSIPFFRKSFTTSRLFGADVSERSLEVAESRFPGLSTPLLIEGERVPTGDDTFDLSFSACVFHHISHAEHIGWLQELRRVTKPEGMLTIFEHNPLNPLTVRAVNTCPFDENAHLIRAAMLKQRFKAAGWKRPVVRYHLFFPRALAALRGMEPSLNWIPFGAQYSVTAVK